MVSGLKLRLSIVGGGPVTVSVAVLRADPPGLLAARVYIVVDPGETVFVPLAGTLPMPGLMETDDVAPLISHWTVACSPAMIIVGLTSNNPIVGAVNHFVISPPKAVMIMITSSTMPAGIEILVMILLFFLICAHRSEPFFPFFCLGGG